MNTRIYKDFDLPTKHIEPIHDHIPQKARSEDEITRRRSLPAGTLILEQQHSGIQIARHIVDSLSKISPDNPSISFSTETLAISGLNTAWYLFGKQSPTQRRRLKLEMLAADDPEQRPSTYMLLRESVVDLSESISVSQRLISEHANQNPAEAAKSRFALGKLIGHTALTLSCAPLGDEIAYGNIKLTNFELQNMARNVGMSALEQARLSNKKIGSSASIAQLADPDSDLSVYWRRNAPNDALDAYELSLEEK